MDRFIQVLNSNQSLDSDASFTVSVGILQRPHGGGKNAKDITNLNPGHIDNSIVSKRSMVYISDSLSGEFTCASRAIVVCHSKLKQLEGELSKSTWTNLIDKNKINLPGQNSQRSQAIRLQHSVGLSTAYPVPVDCLYKFEEHLDLQIIVLASEANNNVIYHGQKSRIRKIFLYKVGNHYHAIVNISKFFQNHKLCEFCLKKHDKKVRHFCNSFCSVCESECIFDLATSKACPDCNNVCRNDKCFERHKAKLVSVCNISDNNFGSPGSRISRCEMFYKCPKCSKNLTQSTRPRGTHVCGEWFCNTCVDYVTEQSHYCYIRACAPKKSIGKHLFFDFETRAEEQYQCADGYSPKPNPKCKHCVPLGKIADELHITAFKCSTCRRCVNCNNWRCGLKEHTPSLLVAQTACDSCKDIPLLPNSICSECGVRCPACNDRSKSQPCGNDQCGRREIVYAGDNVVEEFCSQLFTKCFKNFKVIAHFGKGFDHLFILRYCVENAIFPRIVFAGTKIMNMKVDKGLNISFLDSINFLPMALRDLPKSLGLPIELKKGEFPHLFNTKANENYSGPFPDISFYGVDTMTKARRDEVMKWLNEETVGKIFEMKSEIVAYCRSDVEILRMACMRFRDIVLSITTGKELDDTSIPGVDPFSCITIASCCSKIFRQLYLEEIHDVTLTNGTSGLAQYKGGLWSMKDTGEPISPDDIAEKTFVKSVMPHIPTQGYRTIYNHSKKSIGWLEWMSYTTGKAIQHARTPAGEYKIPGTRIFVDGYAEPTPDAPKGVIFQFSGCRWHGCPRCFLEKRDITVDFRRDQTMNDLLYLKKQTDDIIVSNGYVLISIWECEWDLILKENLEAKNFVETVDVETPLKLRDALFGGRTNATRLFCEVKDGERIFYDDFTSLYPYCNAYKRFPVSHPKIITSGFDETLESYFGIAKVKVLPPRGLYIPILPFRCNGKLTFPLCSSCATKENSKGCNCTENERSWVGTYSTEELKLALQNGYRLLRIYEVYHYEETQCYNSNSGELGLFTEYMRAFLKIKQESSGYPEWVISENDKDEYILSYLKHEGIALEKSHIRKNPGMRSIAKLCLNSLWGKFCERPNRTKTEYVTDAIKFLKLKCDPTVKIRDFHIINDNVIIIEKGRDETFEEESYLANEVVGIFTTSHARVKLAKLLLWLGPDRVLYHDTDSVIYLTREGDSLPLRGDYMGDLTSELREEVYIRKFYSSGPKCYGYEDSEGKTCLKFKGIRLNVQNEKFLNLESIKEAIFNGAQVQLPHQDEFVRDKYNGRIFIRPQSKLYKAVYTKRVILADFNTFPYGY